MKLFLKTKKQLNIIQVDHQNISFEINNKLQIKNVQLKGTNLISQLDFFDELPQEISKRLVEEGILYHDQIFNKMKKLTYQLSWKKTKKIFTIFARTNWEIAQTKCNLVVILKVANNLIIIETRILPNKEIYYGISIKIGFYKPQSFFKSDVMEMQNKIIKFPFQKQEYIHCPNLSNQVKFSQTTLHIKTTLVSNILEKDFLICSPSVWGSKRKIINSWRIRPNKIANTFNTIRLEFKENNE